MAVRVLSLCSGIGGGDLAAEWAGMEIAGQVEKEPFCLAVLQKHWPQVPRKTDIYETKGDEFGTVDLILAGIPCQPFSCAGQRKGASDDRHLWPEVFRIVQVARPAWVVIENVANFVRMALDQVSSDLEAEGYTTGAFVVPACGVNAPHRRDRVFLVAYCQGNVRITSCGKSGDSCRERQESEGHPTGSSSVLAYSPGVRFGRLHHAGATGEDESGATGTEQERQGWGVLQPAGKSPALAHSDSDWKPQPEGSLCGCGRRLGDGCKPGVVSNACRPGLEIREGPAGERSHSAASRGDAGATECRLGGIPDGLSAWMDSSGVGATPEAWERGIPRTVKGQKNRRQRLSGLGNAIVPQQLYPILKAIADIEAGRT